MAVETAGLARAYGAAAQGACRPLAPGAAPPAAPARGRLPTGLSSKSQARGITQTCFVNNLSLLIAPCTWGREGG